MKNIFKSVAHYTGFGLIAVGGLAGVDKLYWDFEHDSAEGNNAIVECFEKNQLDLCSQREYTAAHDEMVFQKKQSNLTILSVASLWFGTALLSLGEPKNLRKNQSDLRHKAKHKQPKNS